MIVDGVMTLMVVDQTPRESNPLPFFVLKGVRERVYR